MAVNPVTDGAGSGFRKDGGTHASLVCHRSLVSPLRLQQGVDVAHDFEGVGDVEDVGLAARPAAVGVEVDGAALVDEAPADDVRLLAVAAGGQALGMARGGAGLADLVQVAS